MANSRGSNQDIAIYRAIWLGDGDRIGPRNPVVLKCKSRVKSARCNSLKDAESCCHETPCLQKPWYHTTESAFESAFTHACHYLSCVALAVIGLFVAQRTFSQTFFALHVPPSSLLPQSHISSYNQPLHQSYINSIDPPIPSVIYQ